MTNNEQRIIKILREHGGPMPIGQMYFFIKPRAALEAALASLLDRGYVAPVPNEKVPGRRMSECYRLCLEPVDRFLRMRVAA